MTSNTTIFEKIFYSTKDKLYWFSKKIMKDDSKVQDCMQQCYMKLWENLKNIDTEKEILPLLYTYARNICIDYLRKETRFVWMENLGMLEEEIYEESNIEMFVRTQDTNSKLGEQLNKLSPRRREVYTMIKLDGFSYREVSEKLNISVSTVEKHMHMAGKDLPGNVNM